jgi:hypothetical protein
VKEKLRDSFGDVVPVRRMTLQFFLATDGLVHLSAGAGGVMGSMRCELWAWHINESLVFQIHTPVPGPATCLQCIVLQDDEGFIEL